MDERARFAELYEQNFERVYAFVARRVPGRAEAEDVVSDVFYKALKGIGGYEERDGVPFVAWLYRIAANVLHDRARHEGRTLSAPTVPAASDADVERRALLFRLVDTLPPAQRDVLVKRFAEERSIAEVARQLGRSEGAVKQLQLRAIEALRAQVRGSHG
ncbi:MAG TPA: sigma-70 family RNA polymerase sigma factor [Thermoanaerobaculia bacterium]|nr:sigma-70 family RNA polymerase sigma factor [Thermoanaerobaculia bacterium]